MSREKQILKREEEPVKFIFPVSRNCWDYIITLNGEIVEAYRNGFCPEANHDILTRNNPQWHTVDIVLSSFFTDERTKFIEICQTLQKDSQGFSIAKKYCVEEIQKKEREISALKDLL